jgi:hypothetical protein
MRKRDRTGEEKQWDGMLKSGLMRLGENPNPSSSERNGFAVTQLHRSTNPFPHVLVWDRMGRKGQKCRVITPKNTSNVQVQFEDGFIATINRQALRRSD